MIELLSNPDAWAALVTLTALEIVLGIDNVIFLSIVSAKLPPEQQKFARQLGLGMALGMRIGLLLLITWIQQLSEPVINIGSFGLSWRDIILLVGGIFLLYKATVEIHAMMEGHEEAHAASLRRASFASVVFQIVLLDIVFSLDSVLTAVAMAPGMIEVMITAVVISIIVMLVAAEPTARFVNKHPTVKMLALSFLLLIGMTLVADGMHYHIERGFIYAAIAFSVSVEALNLMVAARRKRAAQGKDGEGV